MARTSLILLALTAGLVVVGCPGKSRPPPWAIAKLAEQQEAAEAAARRAAERDKPKPPPPSIDAQLSALQRDLKALQARHQADPKDAKLLAEVKALETRGIAVQKRLEAKSPDGEDERLDGLFAVLEALGDLRYALVEAQGGK